MTAKVVVYVSESTAEVNDFASRVWDAFRFWENLPRNNRGVWPTYNANRIYCNEHGIGLELEHLQSTVPSEYRGVRFTAVFIEEDYLEDDGILKAGLYKRGGARAIVARRVNRPTNGLQPYAAMRIEVTSTSYTAAYKLYTDVRGGKVEPTEPWEKNSDK